LFIFYEKLVICGENELNISEICGKRLQNRRYWCIIYRRSIVYFVKERLETIKKEIADVRTAENVTILAATKCVEPERIDLLYDLGVTDIGENRVQELVDKFDKVTKPFNWYFIGRLQTNKVKYIIDKVVEIQSVDSQRLALEIDKQSKKHDKTTSVLVEINMGREENKGGVMPDCAAELCSYIDGLANLKLNGIMCVFPVNADEKLYEEAKTLFDDLRNTFDGINRLSMGMSGDYRIAVKNGSTMVRLGSAIFGKRNYERIK